LTVRIARLGQRLENATPDQRADIEILGSGYGLHWGALDDDLSILKARAGGRLSTVIS
jgi:hypothetical protein